METTKNERVKTLIHYLNIQQVELARTLGIKKQLVNNWVTMSQPVPDKHIITMIEKYPQVDARWLLTGKGSINGAVVNTKAQLDQIRKPLLDIIALKDLVIADKESMLKMKDDIITMLNQRVVREQLETLNTNQL